MTMQATNPLEAFAWKPEYEAEKLVQGLVAGFLEKSAPARELARRMTDETGTRFGDWVDHIRVRRTPRLEEELGKAGFVKGSQNEYVQPNGMFPRIVLHDSDHFEVAVKAESVADFAAINGVQNDIEGLPLGLYRYLPVCDGGDDGCSTRLVVVERHGYRGYTVPAVDAEKAIGRVAHLEEFRARQRKFDDDEAGFEHAEMLVQSAIDDLGVDVTCDIWFAAEREYWMRRNRAAQVQYARQQRLGLGWANHDHHTYRSSRKHFARLVGFFEKLGFVCRERFYAGREAGWGAQVMEQATTGIVTFNDVDLSPDELMGDFAHEPLSERKELGTVGLWCGLHGESFLQAGMHHLEAQFDFEALRKQLEEEASIKTMKPFTDFPYLRQAFTEGERWKVTPQRVENLLAKGQITHEQAKQFRDGGAIGSHLENLERNAGFKGFNQKGVSEIISATDPRKQK